MSQSSLHDFDRLATLSPAERETYRGVDQLGRGINEEAARSGRSRSTVRTLLHRARRKLGEAPRVS